MSGNRTRRRNNATEPAVVPPDEIPRPRRSFARWRALSLSLVYVAFAAHFIHWKIKGKTLAPLELNEVMYTLELGIVTAGFLFMCLLVLGSLIFGRFFCSWACHIMVLQDLCAWLLRKVGIWAKPVRSRVLLWVPALTAFYMFIWPQLVRCWREKAFPTFHLASDAEGWASFVTNNFWRNLPTPWIVVVTFLVCGFVMVYLMGSRTFCAYVCPYGAIFSLVDRFSPGRIRVSDKCRQCGTCTAACTTGIRVHEEVKRHGIIVNPACLKDLDCVAACPQQALSYGPARPALFKSHTSGGRFGSLAYDFSAREDLLIAAVFVAVLLSFRGLYSRVPFLLSLALGGVIGYLAVLALRLVTSPSVTLSTLRLKEPYDQARSCDSSGLEVPRGTKRATRRRDKIAHGDTGRLTTAGRVFSVFVVMLAAFVLHSAFVRYHEYLGLRQVRALSAGQDNADLDALAAGAAAHLAIADRWGLLANERVERGMISASFQLERHEVVETYARRVLAQYPYDAWVRLRLGQSLAARERTTEAEREFRTIITHWAGQRENVPPALASAHQALGGLLGDRGDFAAAARELQRAIVLDPTRPAVHAELGSILAELGQLDAALASLREAIRLDPEMSDAHYNLGTILAHLGRWDEAVACYRKALAGATKDANLHNNLGFALRQTGKLDESRKHLERAIAIDPQNADAHFNLARVLVVRQRMDQASEHFRTAARLDPRYAQILKESASN